jgi:hypothetical protein
MHVQPPLSSNMDEHHAKRRRVENGSNSQHQTQQGYNASHENGRAQSERPRSKEQGKHLARSLPTSLDQTFVGGLYKSNTFKIQIDELLDQVKRDTTSIDQDIAAELRRVKEVIESIPDREPMTVRLNYTIKRISDQAIDWRRKEEVCQVGKDHNTLPRSPARDRFQLQAAIYEASAYQHGG